MNKMLTDKEVLEIQKGTERDKENGLFYLESTLNLCSTVLELQRLLQAEKEARKEDAERALEAINLLENLFSSGCENCGGVLPQHNESCIIGATTRHFKKIAGG